MQASLAAASLLRRTRSGSRLNKTLIGFFFILLAVGSVQILAQSQTDPVGDLQDANGKPATGEPYLDLVSVSLAVESGSYVGRITVVGDIPSQISGDSVYFEWDFLIDSDRNPNTSPWGRSALLQNDIGVDRRVTLFLSPTLSAIVCDHAPPRTCDNIAFQVSGNKITLRFWPQDLGGSTSFDFTALSRKFVNGAVAVFDKAPNEGHFTFQAGTITLQIVKGLPNVSMTFSHSVVYYNVGNDRRAKDIGQAFEYAYDYLEQDFPKPPAKRFTIYVYKTQADLVQGLIVFSGFSPSSANFFKSGGAPRPINYVMHVSPDFEWLTVAHELAHTFIEEYSAEAYLSIKWLDEGLADYEAWRSTSANPARSQEAVDFRKDRWSAFNELKGANKLYPLGALTTEEQWHTLNVLGTARYIYSEAYVVVAYLASTYGVDKILPIFREVQGGRKASEAVKAVLGLTESEILDAVKRASESQIFKPIVATTMATTTVATTSIATSGTTTGTMLAATEKTSAHRLEETVTKLTERAGRPQLSFDQLLVGAGIAVMLGVGLITVLFRKRSIDSLRSH